MWMFWIHVYRKNQLAYILLHVALTTYSVPDNVSASWRAPTFQPVMNKDPHGHDPILVDVFAFTQEIPDKHKRTASRSRWLAVFPSSRGSYYLHIYWRKERKNNSTNLAWYLNTTSCNNDGFTIMSNGSHKLKNKDGISKYSAYTICCCGHGRFGRNNTTKKQKGETKSANNASDKKQIWTPSLSRGVHRPSLYPRQ